MFCFKTEFAKASHAMGGELYYECVGQDSFMLYINLYRDCSGIPASSIIRVQVKGCNNSSFTTLDLAPYIAPSNITNGSDITTLCSSAGYTTTCSGGTYPGTELYQYKKLWVAPQQCNWRFSFSESYRNAAIQNIRNPDTQNLYLEAYLDNTVSSCNNSPWFSTHAVQYLCYQNFANVNQGVIDADGDSLVFSLVQPLVGDSIPAVFSSTFTATQPLNTTGNLNLDTETGIVSFLPAAAQVGVFTILAKEYRNGVLIGSAMREMQVIVLGPPYCQANLPTYHLSHIVNAPNSNNVITGPYDLQACPGDTIRIGVTATGPMVKFFSVLSVNFPGATFDTTRINVDSIYGEFSWVSTLNDTASKFLYVPYGAEQCPFPIINLQKIRIEFVEAVSAGPDAFYCNQGRPIELKAKLGTNHIWSPANGLSTTSGASTFASPSITTDYVVTANISAGCRNTDTVRVNVVPNFNFNIDPSIDTLEYCIGGRVTFGVQADNNFAPYTYHWSPTNSLTDGNTASPTAYVDAPTTYKLTITSNQGCALHDSITIVGYESSFKVEAGKDTFICEGTSLQLNASIEDEFCGTVPQAGYCYPNALPHLVDIGAGNDTLQYSPFYNYFSGKYQSIYLARDLLAQGLKAGSITAMELTVAIKNSTGSYKNFTISLGCTDDTVCKSQYWIPTTEVYSSSSYIAQLGTNNFTFTSSYVWDGKSNLVVQYCYGDSSNSQSGGHDLLLATTTNRNASKILNRLPAFGCDLGPNGSYAAVQSSTPDIRFTFCEAPTSTYTYHWTPALRLSNNTISNPTAIINQNQSYVVTADNGLCIATDTINVETQNLILTHTADTLLCQADTVQLVATVRDANPVVYCQSNDIACIGSPTLTYVSYGSYFDSSYTAKPTPFAHQFRTCIQQYLYSAADLRLVGATAGRITELAFNIAKVNTTGNALGFSIKIKCTDLDSLTSGVIDTGGYTEVFYQAYGNIYPNTGWVNFPFNKGYDWDGQSNLIIQVCFQNVYNSNYRNSPVFISNTTYRSYNWFANTGQDMCSRYADSTLLKGSGYARPDLRLRMCTPGISYDVKWTSDFGIIDTNGNGATLVVPNRNTTYNLAVTSPYGCVLTDSVQIAFGDTASISITSNTYACAGNDSTIFSATIINGGSAPSYQWLLNGNPVGTNDSLYIASNLSVNDKVSCVLTANLPCPAVAIDTSNAITVLANINASASIISFPAPVCPGTATFVVRPANAGQVTMRWLLNGIAVGGNSDTLVLNDLKPLDEVSCELISNRPCVANPILSNILIVSPCVGIEETNQPMDIVVQPNPSSGIYYISAQSVYSSPVTITVYDVNGKELLSSEVPSAVLNQYPIDLSSMGKGVYIMSISHSASRNYKRLVLY